MSVAATCVLMQFFRYLDEGNIGALVELLLPDGIWYRHGKALVGPKMVTAALADRSKTRRTVHLLLNMVACSSEAGLTEVTGYMLIVQHDSGVVPQGPAPFSGIDSIRPIAALLVTEGARWRIVKIKTGGVLFAR